MTTMEKNITQGEKISKTMSMFLEQLNEIYPGELSELRVAPIAIDERDKLLKNGYIKIDKRGLSWYSLTQKGHDYLEQHAPKR